jgi:hypothetical protein
MWLFTTRGFYSVVQDKKNADLLWMRARLGGDLESLRELAPSLGETLEWKATDYRYRASIKRADFTALLAKLAEELTYGNFKNTVEDRQGYERCDLYHDIWAVMFRAQEQERRAQAQARKAR